MPYLCSIDGRHGAAVLYAEHECRRAHVVRRELCDACAGSYLRAFPDGLRCGSCDAITTVSIVPIERATGDRRQEPGYVRVDPHRRQAVS